MGFRKSGCGQTNILLRVPPLLLKLFPPQKKKILYENPEHVSMQKLHNTEEI